LSKVLCCWFLVFRLAAWVLLKCINHVLHECSYVVHSHCLVWYSWIYIVVGQSMNFIYAIGTHACLETVVILIVVPTTASKLYVSKQYVRSCGIPLLLHFPIVFSCQSPKISCFVVRLCFPYHISNTCIHRSYSHTLVVK